MPAQVAMVTGASRGIGREIARFVARGGWDVAIAARTVTEGSGRDDSGRPGAHGEVLPGSLESTAALVEDAGRRVLTVPMDLLDAGSRARAVETVLGTWGRIDLLVNNAVHTGAGSMEPFEELTLEMVRTKLEANVVAQVDLIQRVLPGMLERGGGKVINITSAVAYTDPPAPTGRGGWGMAYAMSKGAFHRVAGILAVEMGDRGILIWNVQPGFVVTERMARNQGDLGLEGLYPGAPPSVPASVVAWLAGPGAAEVPNGSTVEAQRVAKERGLHPDWRRA